MIYFQGLFQNKTGDCDQSKKDDCNRSHRILYPTKKRKKKNCSSTSRMCHVLINCSTMIKTSEIFLDTKEVALAPFISLPRPRKKQKDEQEHWFQN